jgi:DNA adenine methylase
LHWEDGLTQIANLQSTGALPDNIFYYLDPPFFKKADRLYTYYFKDADHQRLKEVLWSLRAKWILSYDYCKEAQELYRDNGQTHVELLYSASSNGGNRIVQEFIVTNLENLPNETRLWRTTEEWKST